MYWQKKTARCTSDLLLLNNYKNLSTIETKNPVTAEIIAVTGL